MRRHPLLVGLTGKAGARVSRTTFCQQVRHQTVISWHDTYLCSGCSSGRPNKASRHSVSVGRIRSTKSTNLDCGQQENALSMLGITLKLFPRREVAGEGE